MNYNANLEPHLAALLFLGSAALLLALILATLILLCWQRSWLRYSIWAIVLLVIGYGVLLLAFSTFSRERVLASGEEKYFCELDCHIAYSVQNVQRMKTIGSATADGEFYVVTVRARFDKSTIAPWRGDAPLTPNKHTLTLVDGQGQRWKPSTNGQLAWDAAHGASTSLMEPLRPGEWYDATFIFDAPSGATAPRLLVTSEGFPMPILIGDESSILHKKTYFAL